jgi:hypothetical protein
MVNTATKRHRDADADGVAVDDDDNIGNGPLRKKLSTAPVSDMLHPAAKKKTIFQFRKDAWVKDFEVLSEKIEEEQRKKSRDLELHPREKLCTEQWRSSRRTQGEEMYENIISDLNSLGLKRTEYQKQFHTAAMHACLFHIFGEDFEKLRDPLMKKYNLESLPNEVLAIMPRRYGKSTMVAMFAAVMLMRIPGIQIAIFSTGRRASSALMAKIVKFVRALPGGNARIVSKNNEDLYVATTAVVNKSSKSEAKDAESTSHLMSFPANAAGRARAHAHIHTHMRVSARRGVVERLTCHGIHNTDLR